MRNNYRESLEEGRGNIGCTIVVIIVCVLLAVFA